MREKTERYWEEHVDSKAFCVQLLYRMPYIVLLGVAGAVLGSGLYLLIAWLGARTPQYQAETEYYIQFAEGQLEAKNHYNDYTWNDVMATDLILGNSMELLGEGYDRIKVQEMITADILSDVRYLTITVTGFDASRVEAISEATTESLEVFGQSMQEFDRISLIENNGVTLVAKPFLTWRAAFFGFVVGAVLALLWSMLTFVLGDSIYTKTDVMKYFSIKPLGLSYSKSCKAQAESMQDCLQQLQHQLKEQNAEVVLLDLGYSKTKETKQDRAKSIEAQLRAEQKAQKKEIGKLDFVCETIDNTRYENYRKADGVVLLIPFGVPCRRKIEDVLLRLSLQDCSVIGAILVDVDTTWMRFYGLTEVGGQK